MPGDVSSWEPYDDDNDGQYTGMYLAMESFRYATTKAPQAKANAKRAFEALRFLQTVTQTPGFVARTVVPSSWSRMHDPNQTFSDNDLAERLVRDPRYKYVPVRWHQSTDGQWLWKGDTSSDEITGHYYGYLIYYDLVADEAERLHVAQHVRNVTDYIVDNGFVLKGMDGKPTRWGVWSPERLNDDPDWEMDRSANSVEMLSYLKAAYHMTGDEKYQQHYLRLINEHGYAENARRSKTMGPAWRTHIDDELLALAYPASAADTKRTRSCSRSIARVSIGGTLPPSRIEDRSFTSPIRASAETRAASTSHSRFYATHRSTSYVGASTTGNARMFASRTTPNLNATRRIDSSPLARLASVAGTAIRGISFKVTVVIPKAMASIGCCHTGWGVTTAISRRPNRPMEVRLCSIRRTIAFAQLPAKSVTVRFDTHQDRTDDDPRLVDTTNVNIDEPALVISDRVLPSTHARGGTGH